jgi:hypothetical protein
LEEGRRRINKNTEEVKESLKEQRKRIEERRNLRKETQHIEEENMMRRKTRGTNWRPRKAGRKLRK